MGHVDPFFEFGGSRTTGDAFSQFGGRIIAKKDKIPNQPTQTKPPTQKELDADRAYNYYHPEIKPYSSGDKRMDFIYNHPWLINTPIIGNMIKEKAYQMALGSHGAETLSDDDIKRIQSGAQKTQYKGQSLLDETPTSSSVNLVDQYFGKISLPASKYKPTSDYLPFVPNVSIKSKWEKGTQNKDISPWLKYINGIAYENGQTWASDNDYSKRKPVYLQDGNDNEITTQLGVNLNGHKLGIAYDSDRKLPYVSVSDAWDFDPAAYRLKNSLLQGDSKQKADRAYVEASLMQQSGHPFKIYDRFYFDPKTRQYIPDDKLPVTK